MLPDSEVKFAHDIMSMVDAIRSYCEEFFAALLLFENCKDFKSHDVIVSRSLKSLPFLAARDGAMTIYHFGKVLHLIRGSFHLAPTLVKLVDTKILKEITKDFERDFPLYMKMRNAIAHAGENLNPSKNHGIEGPINIPGVLKANIAGNIVISSSLSGRMFMYTFENRVVSYSISHESLIKLCDIAEKLKNAFSKIYISNI
jgi:hypothetical protein